MSYKRSAKPAAGRGPRLGFGPIWRAVGEVHRRAIDGQAAGTAAAVGGGGDFRWGHPYGGSKDRRRDGSDRLKSLLNGEPNLACPARTPLPVEAIEGHPNRLDA